MNDHVPLRVSVHRGRPNVMAAKTVVRPKLFPGKAHIGIVRDGRPRLGSSFLFMVSFRFRQQIPGGAREEEKPSRQDTAKQDSYHVPLSVRNPWPSEEALRFDYARRLACPIRRRLLLLCWDLASNRGRWSNGFPKDHRVHSERHLGGPSGRSVRGS